MVGTFPKPSGQCQDLVSIPTLFSGVQGHCIWTDDIQPAVSDVAHTEGAKAVGMALVRVLGVHHLRRGHDCVRLHRRPAVDHRAGAGLPVLQLTRVLRARCGPCVGGRWANVLSGEGISRSSAVSNNSFPGSCTLVVVS